MKIGSDCCISSFECEKLGLIFALGFLQTSFVLFSLDYRNEYEFKKLNQLKLIPFTNY